MTKNAVCRPFGLNRRVAGGERVEYTGWTLRISTLLLSAALVGALQVPRRAHFPTDVIAGGLVGILAERLVDKAVEFLGELRGYEPSRLADT